MGIEFKTSNINLVGIINDFRYNFFYICLRLHKKDYINISGDGGSHSNLAKFK